MSEFWSGYIWGAVTPVILLIAGLLAASVYETVRQRFFVNDDDEHRY